MLGQIAVERGFLDAEELDAYLATQRCPNGEDGPRQPIGALLLREGVLTSSQVVDLLREQRRRNLRCLFEDWTESAPDDALKLLTDPARHVDGFVLVERIGEGGMGVVWKSWDTKLRRWVAVKVLHGESGPEIARFMREAYAAGRLRHPAIVPVHRVAESEGRPYLVMDYIEGGSLDGRTLAPPDAARLVVQVARAVAYAHRRGVIHRDLKPANLLTDRAGRVYVTDFGLAKFGDTASREHKKPAGLRTVTGAAMGTPAYMPPEQALARPLEIDVRSDVYGLGATLYRLLTGHAPFAGGSPAEIILKVLREPPRPPRAIDAAIPRPLEAIVLKCLEKGRDRRYQDADALAEDLDRFLRGEPVEARTSVMLRAVSRMKRVKLRLAGAATVAVVSFVAALALTGAFRREAPPPADAGLPRTLESRGRLHIEIGDLRRAKGEDPVESYRAAVDDLSAAIRVQPRASAHAARAEAWERLAALRTSAGRDPAEERREAAKDYGAVLAIDPTDPAARAGLQRVR